MTTTREDAPTPPLTRSESITHAATIATRVAVAGHEQGAVRRIVLYLIAFGLVISPFPVAAVIPLTLLIATDSL